MKMPRLFLTPILCGFAVACSSLLRAEAIQPKNAIPAEERTPSVLDADSLGLLDHGSFVSIACIVTAVEANEDSLNVGITGLWISSLIEKDSGNGHNGFGVSRGRAISRATWEFFVHRFEDCRGKLVTISISANRAGIIRGGIPLLDFPTDRFEITQPNLSITPTPFSSIPIRNIPSATSAGWWKRWRNPRIRIRADGVFVNDSPKTTAMEGLLEALAYLPKYAWRDGRVVALSAVPGLCSDKDRGEQNALVERVVAILKSAGIASELSRQASE